MTQITQAILDAYLKAYNDIRDGVPGRHREAHVAGLKAAFEAAPEPQPMSCAREPSESARALIDGGFKRAFTYGAEWAIANPIHADMDAQREIAATHFISSFYQPAREPVSDDPIGNPVGPDVDASGLVRVKHSHDYIVETIGQCFARAEMPEEFSPNTLRKSAFLIGDLADRLTTEKAALAAAVSSRDGAVREATRLQHLLSDLQGQHEALKADAAAQPAAQEPAAAGVGRTDWIKHGAVTEMADAAFAVHATAPSQAQMNRLHTAAERLLDLRAAIATLTPAAPKTPDAEDEPEKCFLCGVAFKAGDMVINDITEGTAHRACIGDDRESFVDPVTEEPIGPDEALPTGYPWMPDAAIGSDWRPIAEARHDCTLYELIVPTPDGGGLRDAATSLTIGSNNGDHDGEDRWTYVGWDWDGDQFVHMDTADGAPMPTHFREMRPDPDGRPASEPDSAKDETPQQATPEQPMGEWTGGVTPPATGGSVGDGGLRISAADEAQMALCQLDWIASSPTNAHPHRVEVIRRALERLAQPAPVGNAANLRTALAGLADDYMTSEQHHPGYVLIPTAKFEELRAFGSAPAGEDETGVREALFDATPNIGNGPEFSLRGIVRRHFTMSHGIADSAVRTAAYFAALAPQLPKAETPAGLPEPEMPGGHLSASEFPFSAEPKAETPAGPRGGEAHQKLIQFDVRAEVDEYELRGDNGDYTPTEDERAMLEDFGNGLISALEEAIWPYEAAALPTAPAARPGDEVVQAGDRAVTIGHHSTPIVDSVLPDWTLGISFQQQSVLLLALRGPDGVRKFHPCKAITIAYRATMLRAAMRQRFLEWGEHADTFMSLEVIANEKEWAETIKRFFHHVDELPHHYVAHMAHAAQVIAAHHPDQRMAAAWGKFYAAWCHDLHVEPETVETMDRRLDDWGTAAHRLAGRGPVAPAADGGRA